MQIELRRILGMPLFPPMAPCDERALREAMNQLDGYRVPVESRKAILVAREGDGELIGAWNRKGTAALLSVLPFRREFRYLFGSPHRFGIQQLIMGLLLGAFLALEFEFGWRFFAVGVLLTVSVGLMALVALFFDRRKGRSRFATREARSS